jgi:hypothetical protein
LDSDQLIKTALAAFSLISDLALNLYLNSSIRTAANTFSTVTNWWNEISSPSAISIASSNVSEAIYLWFTPTNAV